MKKNFLIPLFLYMLLFFVFSVWTYTQTDKNLVLTSWLPYWNFQLFLWGIPAQWGTTLYVTLISLLLVVYFTLIKVSNFQFLPSKITNKIFILFIFFALLFSYNALSHDIFNYIFNAKMVMQYQVDPHVHTALEFSTDTWVRFMHNIHTPAPYWYGWTGFSLVPYVLGSGKFTFTLFLFKLWNSIGLLFLFFAVSRLLQFEKTDKKGLFFLILHPLFLIEFISNGHNDAWMMAFAIYSFFLLAQSTHAKNGTQKKVFILTSIVALLFSISMKYVTVLLVPFWVFAFLERNAFFSKFPSSIQTITTWIHRYFYELCAIVFLLPLLTLRSQQFHPWYLLWSFSFFPFIKLHWLKRLLLVLSVSSLYRYVPWLWHGGFEFTTQIIFQQKLITWLPVIVYLLYEATFFIVKCVESKHAD